MDHLTKEIKTIEKEMNTNMMDSIKNDKTINLSNQIYTTNENPVISIAKENLKSKNHLPISKSYSVSNGQRFNKAASKRMAFKQKSKPFWRY